MLLKTPYLRPFKTHASLALHVSTPAFMRLLALGAAFASALLCTLVFALAWVPANAYARGPAAAAVGEIKLSALPVQAQSTLKQIKKNGPYDYAKDGTTFSNREKILPKQKRGYYREFTVKTPGARNRGARRIVAGSVGEYFYTDDHYASFKRIIE